MRSDAKAAIIRWMEVLAGLLLVLLSLWWQMNSWGLSQALGWLGIALGLCIAYAGWQRLRFAAKGNGLGALQIDERRLGYFGPETGGIIDMDELESLGFDGRGETAQWVLTDRSGTILCVPENAAGAEALYDAFSALPGISMARLGAIKRNPTQEIRILWRRVSDTQR